MAYFCYQCGTPLDAGAAECARCGASVRVKQKTTQNRRGKCGAFPTAKILLGAGGVLMIVLLCLLFIGRGRSIDVDKYLRVSFSGYDGYGTATVEFDSERFYRDYSGKIKVTGGSASIAHVEMLLRYIGGSLDQKSGLHNGDKINYIWHCQDDLAKSKYGVTLKHTDQSFKVKGLEKVKTFDAFAYLELSVTGGNGFGRLELNNNAPESSPAAELSFRADCSSGLSNGDTVTVSIDCGWWGQDQLNSALLKQYGALPAQMEKRFTIGGLDELESFDPFDYIEFHLSGISGDGAVTAVVLRDVKLVADASVSFDNRWNLSNGDTVTATVSFGYYGSRADMSEAKARAFGLVPSRYEKTFVIEGLSYYVRNVDDFPSAAEEAMKRQTEDVVHSNVAKSWGSTEHLDSLEYVGAYVLHKKDRSIYGWNNYIDIVYRVNAGVSIPGEGIDSSFSYYYVLHYRDVVVSADGNIVRGTYFSVSDSNRFEPDIPGHSYWYAGFGSLQDVYKRYVAEELEYYSFTASGELPTA